MKIRIGIRASLIMNSQIQDLKTYVLNHGEKPFIDDLAKWIEERGILTKLHVDVNAI